MISVLLIATAATAGAAAGSWVYRRIRGRQVASESPVDVPERGPIALGDVLLLDGGQGRELWAARELAFHEGRAAAFLVLFEADGKADERAILAWEPSDPDHFAVLEPRAWSDAASARLPSTLELSGGDERVTLSARRSARGVFQRAAEAEGMSDLPYEGAALVGIYRGSGRAYALAVRDSGGHIKLYAGRTHALAAVAILSPTAKTDTSAP